MAVLGQNFVVEYGEGLINATSYVDLNTANAYATTYANNSWLAQSVDSMQQFLMDATICIDRLYGQDFYSLPVSHGGFVQALMFPRYTMVVNGIQIVQAGTIPFQLIQATCEVALMDMMGVNLYPQPNVLPFTGSQTVKVGGLTSQQTFKKLPQAEKYTGFWKVEQILYPLLKQSRNPMYLSL